MIYFYFYYVFFPSNKNKKNKIIYFNCLLLFFFFYIYKFNNIKIINSKTNNKIFLLYLDEVFVIGLKLVCIGEGELFVIGGDVIGDDVIGGDVIGGKGKLTPIFTAVHSLFEYLNKSYYIKEIMILKWKNFVYKYFEIKIHNY